MEFDQLCTMLAVLEHGSFTRAGQSLGLSQSTVSFHIKSLEGTLGCRLLDRGRDGVQPTAAGKIVRGYAERIIALRTEAIARLQAEEQGRTGHVTVAASTIPAEVLLPPVLAKLRTTHPGVSVTVAVSDSGGAVARLLAGECDLALVGAAPQDRRLVARPCATDEVVLVGPSPNPFAIVDGDPTALATTPLVLRQESSGTRAAVADIIARHVDDNAGTRVTVGSSEAAKRCVLAGLGLAFVSRQAVADELKSGRLEVVALQGLPVVRQFHLVRVRAVTPSSATSALIDRLLET